MFFSEWVPVLCTITFTGSVIGPLFLFQLVFNLVVNPGWFILPIVLLTILKGINLSMVDSNSSLNSHQRTSTDSLGDLILTKFWQKLLSSCFIPSKSALWNRWILCLRGSSLLIYDNDRPHNLPSNPSELLCIHIVRAYTNSYVDLQNSLFCLLICNSDHKAFKRKGPELLTIIFCGKSTNLSGTKLICYQKILSGSLV